MSDLSTIPRYRALPLIGNLFELRRDPMALLEAVLAACGDVGSFAVGPRRVVLLASPEDARIVLFEEADAFEKGPVVRTFARPILGDGLIACENAVHRARRRAVAPAFAQRALERYAQEMREIATRVLDHFREGEPMDVGAVMTELTLRVVGRTLFSVDLVDESRALSEALAEVLRFVTGRIESPIGLPLIVPTARHRRVRAAIARLDATILRMIADRRRAPRSTSTDLLDAMIEEGSASDRQIRDEAMNLFLAGHETSANALTWTLHLLAHHPDAQARVRDEARALNGLDASVISAMPYTQRVWKESLRLYPPVHSLGRQATRAVRLSRHRLEVGAVVIVSPYLMHRRPELFADPLRFDPDRFSSEAEAAIARYAYLPFGAGPRACIGGQFATIEALITLAALCRRMRLEPISPRDVQAEMLITLRPRQRVRAWVRSASR